MYTYPGDPNKGFKTSLSLPDDNNKPTAAMMDTIWQTLLDNDAFMRARGVRALEIATGTITGSVGAVIGPVGQANVWQNFSNANGVPNPCTFPSAASWTSQAYAGDRLFCFASGPFLAQGGDPADVRLMSIQDYLGPNETSVAITGATRRIVAAPGDIPQQVTLIGVAQVVQTGTCWVRLQGRNRVSDGSHIVGIPGGVDETFTMVCALIRPMF